MAGYNNADWAAVLPSNVPQIEQTANTLYAQSERRRLEAERDAQKQQQRQDMLGKYIGTQFDDKDYMTGTDLDPVIHQKLNESMQKYSQMLIKNPGMSLPELQYMMQKDMGNISDYSSKIKAINANIASGAKEFDKSPGIDGQALQNLAKTDAYFKTDPATGKRVPKDVSELDPSQDYLTPAVMNHPEKYLDEGKAREAALENYKKMKYKVGADFETSYGGRNRKLAYTGDLYPFQQVMRDANGKEVVNGSGKAQYGLRTVPAMLDGKPVEGDDGKPLEIMNPEIYHQFNSDKSNAALLNKQLNDFNAQQIAKGQAPIPNGTPEADIKKNSFLKDWLKDVPADFTTIDKTTEANFLARHQAGMDMTLKLSPEAKELVKQQKENTKLEGTDPAIALRALGGDGSVIGDAKTEQIGDKTMFDVTNEIGGLKLKPDVDGKAVRAQGLYVDPTTKTMVVKNQNGEVTEYKGRAIRTFWKNIAPYNGITLDKVDKILNMYLDANGNYVGKEDKSAIVKMAADKDLANLQYQKAVDSKSLPELKGFTLPDQSVITNINTRPPIGQLIGMDKFSIGIKTPDGKTVTKTFPTEEELRQYLKDQSK